MFEHHSVNTTLECREATGSPGRLTGIVLPVGRVASDRAELFVASGVTTPSEGVRLLSEHRSENTIMLFDPIRGSDGSLMVDHLLPNTPEGQKLAEAVRSGRTPGLSVEFHALAESRSNGGRVREIQSSLVVAVAAVASQSYQQSRAEIRSKQARVVWL